MLRHVKYIPVFLLFISALPVQVIGELNITGNLVFDDDDYLNWSGVNTGEKFTLNVLDTIRANIAAELGNRGYLGSKIDSTTTSLSADSQKVTIKLTIDEGDPTYVNHFIYTGADSEDTLKVLPL